MDLSAVTNLTTADFEEFQDMTSWSEHYTRQRGYIVPPSDNEYQLFVAADDRVQLYFSMTADPADKVYASIYVQLQY